MSVWDGHVIEPCEMSGVGNPTVGITSSVHLHICSVTHMTEISLDVT